MSFITHKKCPEFKRHLELYKKRIKCTVRPGVTGNKTFSKIISNEEREMIMIYTWLQM